MATAKTPTKLRLDRFAEILQIHPLHFNSVHLDDFEFGCGEPIYQYSWQSTGRIGREEIANAIAQAEQAIEDQLLYRLLPSYEEDERHPLDPRMWQPRFKTDWGYVQSGGSRAKASIEASAAITWGTADDVGYKRTGTVVVATTVTNTDEIVVYYPGHMGEDGWVIQPQSIVIAGGVVTITLRRERCVLEETLESYTLPSRPILGTDDAQFISTVDVGRVYTDPSAQMSFLWTDGCACGCTTCLHSTQGGCMTVVDSPRGIVVTVPSTYDSTTGLFTQVPFNPCTRPNSTRLWYRGGLAYNPHDYTVMDPEWERAVTYLALTMLKKPLCNCNTIMDAVNYWCLDLSEITDSSRFQVRYLGNITNPLGTSRAGLNAWRLIQQRALGQAVLV